MNKKSNNIKLLVLSILHAHIKIIAWNAPKSIILLCYVFFFLKESINYCISQVCILLVIHCRKLLIFVHVSCMYPVLCHLCVCIISALATYSYLISDCLTWVLAHISTLFATCAFYAFIIKLSFCQTNQLWET